jgi:predicted DNA-binding transcriptional regulator AlpA
MNENFLKVVDLAQLLKVHKNTAFKITKEPGFPKPYVFYHGQRRWSEADILKWIKERRVK